MTADTGQASQRNRDRFIDSSRVLADAFAHDPWANHVLNGRAAEKPGALAALMCTPVRVAYERGGLVTLAADPAEEGAIGAVSAVSTWVPATDRRIDTPTAFRTGAVSLPFRIGPRAFGRLIRDETDLDATLDGLSDSQTAYLWVLGVSRRHHGLGLGRRAVDATCRQAAERGYRSLVLNTDNPGNVAIYEALGFSLVERRTRRSGLTAHLLRRELAQPHG